MTEVIQPIPARLKNVAVGGHVAGAADIIDDTQQKDQETINSELISAVGTGGSVDSKIAASKAEIIGDAATDYNTLGKLEDKIQAEASRAEGAESALDGRVDTLEDAVGTGGSVDSRISAAVATETTRAQAAEADRYTKSETYSKTELNNLITTPNQEYVSVIATAQTTAVTDVLPATGAADTTYRVGNWDGTQYNDSVFSEYAWDGSAYIKLSTKSQVGEVYDISVNHADTKYADLAAALGTNGANIPQSLRKGGMSVKFVRSSDNKYVQYFLTKNEWSAIEADWEKMNLEEEVSQLVQKITGVIDYNFIVGKYLSLDGAFNDLPGGSCKYSNKILCSPGDKFLYEGQSKYAVAGWILYNNDTIVSSGNKIGTEEITIPSGVNYIQFGSYAGSSTTESDVIFNVVKINPKPIDEKINELNNDIDALDESVNSLVSDVVSENLFNKNSSDNVYDKFLSSGTPLDADGLGYSHLIPIEYGEDYSFKTSDSFGGTKIYVFLYNEAQEYLGVIEGTLDQSHYNVVHFTQNNISATFARINFGYRQVYYDTLMFVKDSQYPDEYIEFYNYRKLDESIHVDQSQKNKLLNSSISLNGDSICSGIGFLGGYGKMIADKYNMQYSNIAVGGGTIAYVDSERHCISRTIIDMPNADYILLEGGVNDSSLNVPIGELSNGYDATLDDTTYFGAFESMLKTLITRFKGKKYGYIAVHKMSDNYSSLNPAGVGMFNAAKLCCEKWGVPFLDLNSQIPAFGFFDENGDSDLYALRTEYTYQGDGWHPNKDGYEKYYVPKIEAWLQSL